MPYAAASISTQVALVAAGNGDNVAKTLELAVLWQSIPLSLAALAEPSTLSPFFAVILASAYLLFIALLRRLFLVLRRPMAFVSHVGMAAGAVVSLTTRSISPLHVALLLWHAVAVDTTPTTKAQRTAAFGCVAERERRGYP